MKNFLRLWCNFAWLAVVAQWGNAYGSTAVELQGLWQAQISSVVRGYDDNAVVVVEVIPAKLAATKLPGTNFLLDETIVRDQHDNVKIDRVAVTVYSGMAEITSDMKDVVRKIVGAQSKNVKIDLKPAIPGYTTPSNVRIGSYPDMPAANEARTKLVAWVESYGRIVAIAVGIAAFFILILTITIFRAVREFRTHSQALSGAARAIADAVEMGSGGRRDGGSSERTINMAKGAGGGYLPSGGTVSNEFSDESLLAVLSDAYWCGQDQFAAAYWQKIPVGRKQALLSRWPYGQDYVAYLAELEGEAANWDQHPYYLNPQPLDAVDNEAVVELTRKHAWLAGALSPMRLSSLPLSADEILALQQRSGKSDGERLVRDNLPKSAPRSIAHGVRIASRSNEDDQRLMGRSNANIDEIRQVVSLAWAVRLDQDSLKGILQKFTAYDLAQAWVGPGDLLAKFENSLPEKKLRMVKTYVERGIASRQSPAYMQLHDDIIAALDKGNASEGRSNNNRSSQKSAA